VGGGVHRPYIPVRLIGAWHSFPSPQQLQELIVEGTQVTENGVAELQKALPKCKVYHNAK
jgi:hypothetical protein